MATTTGGSEDAPAAGYAAAAYRERLYVPWTWWLLGFGAATLLCLEVTTTLVLGHLWVGWQVITAAAVAGVLTGGLVSWSRAGVAVAEGELIAGPARLPVRFVGEL